MGIKVNMGIYRNIHCMVWSDDKFPFLSDNCQLVWFHLKTTPFSNPLGIFKASIEGLAAEKRWPLKRYAQTFEEGLSKGFWEYDERFHVVYFPKYFKHNLPDNPNVLKGWIKFYNEIPPSPLKDQSIQTLKGYSKAWGEGYVKVCETLRQTLPKQERESKRERERESKREKEKEEKSPPSPPEKIKKSYLKEDDFNKFLNEPEYIKQTAIALNEYEKVIETYIKIIRDKCKSKGYTGKYKYYDLTATIQNWIKIDRGEKKNGFNGSEQQSKTKKNKSGNQTKNPPEKDYHEGLNNEGKILL